MAFRIQRGTTHHLESPKTKRILSLIEKRIYCFIFVYSNSVLSVWNSDNNVYILRIDSI